MKEDNYLFNNKKYKILFVCLGNICRSPSAEAVMKKLVKDAGMEDRFLIDSAGIIGYHEGEPPILGCVLMLSAGDIGWILFPVRFGHRISMISI